MTGRYLLEAGCCLAFCTIIATAVVIAEQAADYGRPAAGMEYLRDGMTPRPLVVPAENPESRIPAALLRQLSPAGDQIINAAVETQ